MFFPMKSCLHKRCQFSFAEATFIPTTADPYDMDSDIDQQNSHHAMDSMEEDQSSFQGPEDMESRLSPSKDTVSEDDDTKDTSLALNHSPVSSQTIRNKRNWDWLQDGVDDDGVVDDRNNGDDDDKVRDSDNNNN